MFYCAARIQENIWKYVLIGLILQYRSVYRNKTSLSFSDRSIYYLMVEKNVAAMAKFQSVRGAFHHLTLMDNCQKFFVSALLFQWMIQYFFVFCCVRGVGFVAVAGLLSLMWKSLYLTWQVTGRDVMHISLPFFLDECIWYHSWREMVLIKNQILFILIFKSLFLNDA